MSLAWLMIPVWPPCTLQECKTLWPILLSRLTESEFQKPQFFMHCRGNFRGPPLPPRTIFILNTEDFGVGTAENKEKGPCEDVSSNPTYSVEKIS